MEGRVVAAHIAEHGRLEVEILVATTGRQGRARGLCLGDDARGVVTLLGIDQRPDRHLAVGRIADLERFRLGHQLFQKARMDAALDQHAAGGHADLALVQVDAPRRVGDGQLHVRIVEHDQRVLAAQFQRHLLQVFARRFTDLAPGTGGAGELDHRDVRVAGQRRTGRAITGQHVQQAGRQPSQFEQACDHEATAHGGARIGLEHHRIAQRQCRGDCAHGQIQREVERRDHADHAERSAARQIQTARFGRQHFTDAARGQCRRFMQRLGVHLGLKAGLELGGATFADQPLHDLVVVLFGQLRGTAQDLRAGVIRGAGPVALRLGGGGGGARDLRRVGHRDLAQAFAGGRFDHILGAGTRAPLTLEQLAGPRGRRQECVCCHL